MSLSIRLRFPTERYVAASMGRKDEVEWPPHPARLMLGLLATHYRGYPHQAEHAALQWLCEQPPPEIYLPPEDLCSRETMTGVFVPQNPTEAKGTKHPRKERCFTAVVFPSNEAEILFHWPNAEPDSTQKTNLAALVGRLPRFGHSSSLVMAELLDAVPDDAPTRRLVPLPPDDLSTPEFMVRVPWSGLIQSAEVAFAADEREKELQAAFERRDVAALKGKALTKFQASPRGRYDPRHQAHGYKELNRAEFSPGPWHGGLVVLKQVGGDRIGLESTWQLTSTLHKTLLERWTNAYPDRHVPSWISGHETGDGSTAPLRECHLAMIPLAHLGHKHARGHLLGLGFALPEPETCEMDRAAMRNEWRQLLAALFAENHLQLSPRSKAWTVNLSPLVGEPAQRALDPRTWTRPSREWTSVTPIILDRHPKPKLAKDPVAWLENCRDILAESCHRAGFPAPLEIFPALQGKLPGTPPAPAFPHPEKREGRPQRFHIHATIVFPEEVAGPVLLGAGRFRGYGLMRPTTQSS